MGFEHRYAHVKETDDLNEEPQPTIIQASSTSWWKILLSNFVAACVGAGVMFLIARHYSVISVANNTSTASAASTAIPSATSSLASVTLPLPTPSIEHVEAKVNIFPNDMDGIILDCGYSPSEARAKGCVYDVMMQDWVPEPCYDSVLTERYLAMGNYTWYADGDGKTTISDEVMRKGEHGRAWMSTKYHKDHCVFSWIKIIRALRNSHGISQELLSYDHVLHCSHGALKEQDGEDNTNLGVSAPTNYAKCAIYETWKMDFIPDKHNATSR